MLSMGAAHDDVLDVLYLIYNLKFGRIGKEDVTFWLTGKLACDLF